MNQKKQVCGDLFSNLTDIQTLIISGDEILTEKGNIGFFNYSNESEFITSAGTFKLIHEKNKIPFLEGKIYLEDKLILEWEPIQISWFEQTLQFKNNIGEVFTLTSLGSDYTIENEEEDMVFSLRPNNSKQYPLAFFCIISRHYEISTLFAAFIFKIRNDIAEKREAYDSFCPVAT